MNNGSPIPSNWYASAFGELYPILYAHRDVESARQETEFAVQQTGLSSSEKALDLCCGNGRHLFNLGRYTPFLTGLDFSAQLLKLAQNTLEVSVPLIRADMRALPFAQCFDVVFSFFTSFGYFMDENDNRSAALSMAQALKPGGRFFFDFLNATYVQRNLQPHSERLYKDWNIVEERWIDYANMRVNKQTKVVLKDECIGETRESVRLYTYTELSTLLCSVDLEIDRTFGDYDGTAFRDARPRLIIVGHRKY
jgi:SAM-dependent methyltransferase